MPAYILSWETCITLGHLRLNLSKPIRYSQVNFLRACACSTPTCMQLCRLNLYVTKEKINSVYSILFAQLITTGTLTGSYLLEMYVQIYVQLITTRLFQMMSVHPNPIISSLLMQSLQTIALSAAQHIGMLKIPHSGQLCCSCPTDKELKLTVVLQLNTRGKVLKYGHPL